MKKFLMGVIFVIPIIIVLAITATGKIITLNNPLNASSMEIRNSENEIIEKDVNDIIYIDSSNNEEFIVVNLFPSITDQAIVYNKNDKLANAGDVELERVGETNHYLIVPQFDEYGFAKSGPVEITVFAANSSNVSQTITIVVSSEIITDLVVYDEDGEDVSEGFGVYSDMQMYCEVVPIDAMESSSVTWESSDERVLKVSKNGLITPVSRGEAVLTVSADDKHGNHFEKEVPVDTSAALVKSTSIKISDGENVDEWLSQNIVLSGSAVVSPLGNGVYMVSENGINRTVVIGTCANDDIEFAKLPSTLYVNNGTTHVEVKYSDEKRVGSPLNYRINVSNESVLRYDAANGVLVPISAGTSTVTAVASNGKKVSENIVVKERPIAFNLMYTEASEEVGIKRSRTWGYYWLDANNTLVNTLQFGCSLGLDKADLLWEVNDTSLAEIDQNALITFKPECAGKKVTVKATVLVNNYKTSVFRTFTFNIADGASSVNVYDYDDMHFVTENTDADMAIQSSMCISDMQFVKGSIYGNGFRLTSGGLDDDVFRIRGEHLTDNTKVLLYEDIWYEGAADLESAKTDANNEALDIEDVENPVIVRYCILQYCNISIQTENCKNLLIEGCLLGYTINNAIQYGCTPNNNDVLTIKNCVMRNSEGPSIIFQPSAFNETFFDVNNLPTVNIEGFMEITNWKQPAELEHLFSGLGTGLFDQLSGFMEPDAFIDALVSLVEELFARDDMAHLLYTRESDGAEFINLGVFILGWHCDIDISRLTIEDKALAVLTFSFPKNDGSGMAILASAIDGFCKSQLGMTIYHPNYIVSYDFSDGKLPRYLPEQSIPQDFALYARLRGE